MKLKIFLLFFFVSSLSHAHDNDWFWGQTGHRVVGEIAAQNLTKKAKRNIEKLLGAEGLAMVSTFADDIKSDKQYDDFKPWHYINFEDDETYESSKKNPKGDLIIGIKKCKEVILDPNASQEDKVFYLKMLVHLVGDLHQPLHVGRGSDRGGNSIKVSWFGRKTNLHAVWDSRMLESFGMTYSELSTNLNKFSKAQIAAIQQGTPEDWVKEVRVIAQEVYKSAKQDEDLRYRYNYDHIDTLKSQLQKGGLRLAKVLNDLFG
jgi:hypothetical protein